MVGRKNNTVNLRPTFQMDFTAIAAQNCTSCPLRNFDANASETEHFLKPVTPGLQAIEIGIKDSNYSFLVNGTFVTDTLSTTSNLGANEKIYTNATSDVYTFFLIQNITTGSYQKDFFGLVGDGLLGMTPNLGSGKQTFGQYLKGRKFINEDSFAIDFNASETTRAVSITYGKFNTTAPSSSISIKDVNSGKKAWLLSSTGFSVANQSFDFPANSFVQIELLAPFNGYMTQDETRFNSTVSRFNETWFNLTNGTMNLEWITRVDDEKKTAIPIFKGHNCYVVNTTIT